MSISPFKTFSAGEVLTASDLNSSFTQITNNGEDLGWPATKAKDLNGQELILDADGDTSITSDTDDQIDVKIGGNDVVILTPSRVTTTASITSSGAGIRDILVESTINGGRAAYQIKALSSTGAASAWEFGANRTADDTLEVYDITNSTLAASYKNGVGWVFPTDIEISGSVRGDVTLSDGKVEITETVNNIPLKVNANFATQTNVICQINAARAATDAFEFIRCFANSVERLRINGLGNVLNTNNSYGALSDIKIKINLRPANSQWDDIKSTASIMQNYQLKAEYALDPNSKFHLGVVAQDLQLISPSLVSASPDKEVIIVQEAVAEVKDANGIIITQAVEEITETRIVLDAEGKEIVTLGVNYSLIYLKAVKALGEAMERIEVLEAKDKEKDILIANMMSRLEAGGL
jgi:hypothetical protein